MLADLTLEDRQEQEDRPLEPECLKKNQIYKHKKYDYFTAQSFLVLLIAALKFSNVSWWYSGSPHEKSNLATGTS